MHKDQDAQGNLRFFFIDYVAEVVVVLMVVVPMYRVIACECHMGIATIQGGGEGEGRLLSTSSSVWCCWDGKVHPIDGGRGPGVGGRRGEHETNCQA